LVRAFKFATVACPDCDVAHFCHNEAEEIKKLWVVFDGPGRMISQRVKMSKNQLGASSLTDASHRGLASPIASWHHGGFM
jgi:hypothetical protein